MTDHAALSLLAAPPDDGEPVTPEDVALMGACEVCGGEGSWLVSDAADGEPATAIGHVETCPPPPDGCGGTRKRGGR